MEEKIYCFGIKRENKLLALEDPIQIRNGFEIREFGEHYPASETEKVVRNFFVESNKLRGVLFGYVESTEEINNFLEENVKFLSPTIQKEGLSIFFLEDEESVLFKFNKLFFDREDIIEEVYMEIIRKFTSIKKEEFREQTNQEEEPYEDFLIKLENPNISLSSINFFPVYACIKPENYGDFKRKVSGELETSEER